MAQDKCHKCGAPVEPQVILVETPGPPGPPGPPGGVEIGDVTGTAYDGGKGAALEVAVKSLDINAITPAQCGEIVRNTCYTKEEIDDSMITYEDIGEAEDTTEDTTDIETYEIIDINQI